MSIVSFAEVCGDARDEIARYATNGTKPSFKHVASLLAILKNPQDNELVHTIQHVLEPNDSLPQIVSHIEELCNNTQHPCQGETLTKMYALIRFCERLERKAPHTLYSTRAYFD